MLRCSINKSVSISVFRPILKSRGSITDMLIERLYTLTLSYRKIIQVKYTNDLNDQNRAIQFLKKTTKNYTAF